jgi:hypothetical protein
MFWTQDWDNFDFGDFHSEGRTHRLSTVKDENPHRKQRTQGGFGEQNDEQLVGNIRKAYQLVSLVSWKRCGKCSYHQPAYQFSLAVAIFLHV